MGCRGRGTLPKWMSVPLPFSAIRTHMCSSQTGVQPRMVTAEQRGAQTAKCNNMVPMDPRGNHSPCQASPVHKVWGYSVRHTETTNGLCGWRVAGRTLPVDPQ